MLCNFKMRWRKEVRNKERTKEKIRGRRNK
jgi:hypothetical protein